MLAASWAPWSFCLAGEKSEAGREAEFRAGASAGGKEGRREGPASGMRGRALRPGVRPPLRIGVRPRHPAAAGRGQQPFVRLGSKAGPAGLRQTP